MFDDRKIQEQVIFEAVKEASNEKTATEIVYGKNNHAVSENDSDWIKSTMERMDERFDEEERKKIRMRCQCGYGMDEKLTLVQDLMKGVSSLEEFGNHEGAKSAGMHVENGVLYLSFPFCPCPMLASVDRLESDTWCQCTTGYSKVLFEKAFGCEVDVKLLKSVKMGDDVCLMTIIPKEMIWYKEK